MKKIAEKVTLHKFPDVFDSFTSSVDPASFSGSSATCGRLERERESEKIIFFII